MKKTALLLIACATLAVAPAYAATTASTAAPATASTATPQQTRMKTCAAQYHQKGIAKSQYKTFMSQCLKDPANAAPAKAPAAAK